MAACRMDLRLHKNPYGTILHIVIILAKPQDLKKKGRILKPKQGIWVSYP